MASRRDTVEFTFGDIVLIKGLKSEKGKQLNGKKGTILPSDEVQENKYYYYADTANDPCVALKKNGRFIVRIEVDQAGVKEKMGQLRHSVVTNKDMFNIKRENLELLEGSLQSTLSASQMRELGILTIDELEASDPGMKDIFSVIEKGDHVRLREIMEHIERTYNVKNAADDRLDGAGNGPLIGAVELGHLQCVEVLLEYGADVNKPLFPLHPSMSKWNLSMLHVAISSLVWKQSAMKKTDVQESFGDKERIIELIIKAGADVNHCCPNNQGTPITSLIFASDHSRYHDSRLRVLKILLDHNADPNILYPTEGDNEALPIVDIICIHKFGPLEYRIEIAKLLLEYAADPGKFCKRPGDQVPGDQVNGIFMAIGHRIPRLLELFLQSDKGSKSVNVKNMIDNSCYEGENALLHAFTDTAFGKENGAASRERVILLLQYGGDIYQRREDGLSPFDWIIQKDSSKKHIELRNLLLNAPKFTDLQGTMNYWNPEKNVQVKEFIGSKTGRQCPVCMSWSDDARGFIHQKTGLSTSRFQRCAGCQKQWYCSKECQKLHWPFHKQTCKKGSK